MDEAQLDEAQLDVKDIHVFYGNIEAVKGMSFHVNQGEIVCLIGANGAGKTTTLRTVSGLLNPREGAIFYEGQRIDMVPAHEIVALGVAQSPEGRRIFPRMSVRENLDMGAFIRRDPDGQREDMDRIMELFPILKERARQAAGTLSGGEQQMLAMGRALMARPKLLLLDEPSMGLAPLVVQTIFDTIRDINAQGMTVLLVEQNAAQALSLAHRGYVIETGRIVLEDEASDAARERAGPQGLPGRGVGPGILGLGDACPAGAENLWLRSRTFPVCARSLLGPRTPAPDGPRGPRGDPDCRHANSRPAAGQPDQSLVPQRFQHRCRCHLQRCVAGRAAVSPHLARRVMSRRRRG